MMMNDDDGDVITRGRKKIVHSAEYGVRVKNENAGIPNIKIILYLISIGEDYKCREKAITGQI